MSVCSVLGTPLGAAPFASGTAPRPTFSNSYALKYVEALLLIGTLFGCLVVSTVVSQGL